MPQYNKHKEPISDNELIQRYRNSHDLQYAGTLYMRYSHLVFGVSMKYLKNSDDAEDAVMAIFEELITQLKRHEVQNFPAWLHMVAKNHCLMKLRKESSHLKKAQEYYHTAADDDMETEDWLHLESKQNKEMLLRALEEKIPLLKSEQKVCIELFYMKEKSYKEVSEITGYSLNEVKSYIQNGKRNLKILIEEDNG